MSHQMDVVKGQFSPSGNVMSMFSSDYYTKFEIRRVLITLFA